MPLCRTHSNINAKVSHSRHNSLWPLACVPPTQLIAESLWHKGKAPRHLARCPSPFAPPSLFKAFSGCLFDRGKYIPQACVSLLDAWRPPRRIKSVFGVGKFATHREKKEPCSLLKRTQMLNCVYFFSTHVFIQIARIKKKKSICRC